MVQLLGEGGWIFNRARSFHLWNGSVIAYVVLMTVAGWREGFDPAFTIVPGVARNCIYALRLLTGILMLVASFDWFQDASALLQRTRPCFHPRATSTGEDSMNRPVLLAYQALIGLSDTLTGALLIIAPEFTLRLMGLHVPSDALPYVSFIGAFVLSVGLACLYGAIVMARRGSPCTLEAVWLLTAITRASVAIFVVTQVLGQHARSRAGSRLLPPTVHAS